MFGLGYFEQIEGTNCLEEFDEILAHVNTIDYTRLDVTQKNAFTYICGYLIKKCLDKHKCHICLEFGKETNILNMENIYSHFRAYPNSKQDIFENLQCLVNWQHL